MIDQAEIEILGLFGYGIEDHWSFDSRVARVKLVRRIPGYPFWLPCSARRCCLPSWLALAEILIQICQGKSYCLGILTYLSALLESHIILARGNVQYVGRRAGRIVVNFVNRIVDNLQIQDTPHTQSLTSPELLS